MVDDPRQRIDAAVGAHLQEHGNGELVIGWVTVVATTNVDDNGDTVSGITTISSDDSLAWTTYLGMLEAARIRAHKQFGGYDDD